MAPPHGVLDQMQATETSNLHPATGSPAQIDSSSSWAGLAGSGLQYREEATLLKSVNKIISTTIQYWSPKALYTAVSLGVPDALAAAGGPQTAAEIARRVGAKEASLLQRLLRALAANGFFTESEDEDPRYGLNETSNLLTSQGPFAGFVLHECEPASWLAWDKLTEAIQNGVHEGTYPFELATGGKSFFGYYKEHKESAKWFNDAMQTWSLVQGHALLEHYAGFKSLTGTLVDVGGNRGVMLSKILAQNPNINGGVVFDLPHVLKQEGVVRQPNVRLVGGDMFKEVPKADAIFMKMICHDWDDEACIKLLRNCHNALPVGGKLLVVEVVVANPGQTGKETLYSKEFDLHMLALLGGGKERTERQWRNLLEGGGFEVVGMTPCPSVALQHVIEGVKK